MIDHLLTYFPAAYFVNDAFDLMDGLSKLREWESNARWSNTAQGFEACEKGLLCYLDDKSGRAQPRESGNVVFQLLYRFFYTHAMEVQLQQSAVLLLLTENRMSFDLTSSNIHQTSNRPEILFSCLCTAN